MNEGGEPTRISQPATCTSSHAHTSTSRERNVAVGRFALSISNESGAQGTATVLRVCCFAKRFWKLSLIVTGEPDTGVVPSPAVTFMLPMPSAQTAACVKCERLRFDCTSCAKFAGFASISSPRHWKHRSKR